MVATFSPDDPQCLEPRVCLPYSFFLAGGRAGWITPIPDTYNAKKQFCLVFPSHRVGKLCAFWNLEIGAPAIVRTCMSVTCDRGFSPIRKLRAYSAYGMCTVDSQQKPTEYKPSLIQADLSNTCVSLWTVDRDSKLQTTRNKYLRYRFPLEPTGEVRRWRARPGNKKEPS